MFNKLKAWIRSYDNWCKTMGLTPENRRCCVPLDRGEVNKREESSQGGDYKQSESKQGDCKQRVKDDFSA